MNLSRVNPFTLFLILILLILGTQPNCDKELEKVSNILSVMQESSSHIKAGVVKLQAIMQ